jgi:hypothetical protein
MPTLDGTFTASSFRTLGTAAIPQNLFSIENATGSAKLVAVRRLNVVMDATAVLTNPAIQVRTSRVTTLPTGGTTLTKVSYDTGVSSNASIVVRGATASDGGTATAITATASSIMYESFGQRMHTNVGQVLTDIIPALPLFAETEPIWLLAQQALLVQINATAAASNASTNHYITNVTWQEYTP